MSEIDNLRELVRIAGAEITSAGHRYQRALRALAEIRSAGMACELGRIERLTREFEADLATPELTLWRKALDET